MKIKWYASDLNACGRVRGEDLAQVINRDYAERAVMDVKVAVFKSDLYQTDVMVFQRQCDPSILRRFREAKKHGIKCVYEIDDNLLNLPEEFRSFFPKFWDDETRDSIKAFLKDADMVTVSTPQLAMQLSEHVSGPITILENTLPIANWNRTKPVKSHVSLVWMASRLHQIDMPLIQGVLLSILEENPEVTLSLIGDVRTDSIYALRAYRDRIQHLDWVDASELPETLAHYDIGLAPLIDVPFNHARSPIKALQYWASSMPVVCSEGPAYSIVAPGETGFRCSTGKEWYDAITLLIRDKAKRLEMGAKGRKVLEERYDMKYYALNWLSTFQGLLDGGA